MANYDTVLGDEPPSSGKKNFGWTAPKHVSGCDVMMMMMMMMMMMTICSAPFTYTVDKNNDAL